MVKQYKQNPMQYITNKLSIFLSIPLFIAIVLFTLPAQSYAAQLSAEATKKEFTIGEDVTIKVSLMDAKSKHSPDLSKVYDKGFTMIRQNYSVKTRFTNGKYVKNVIWIYSFRTKLKGKITIPPISLKTNKGTLTSKPFEISISATNNSNDTLIGKNVIISSEIDSKSPYINQSLTYKVTVTKFINVYKEDLIGPESEQAVIEMLVNPRSYRATVKEREAIITEYFYSITPITAGKIKISAPIYKGKIARETKKMDPFMDFNNIISFSDLRQYEDFVIAGKKQNLNVNDAKKTGAWLPLKELKVSTRSLGGNHYVGDALNFQITLDAKNVNAKQLPNLKFPRNANYKIYNESPVLSTLYDPDLNELIGQKIFKFTLVPSKPGTITIPSLEIPWWDVNAKKAKTAKSKPFSINVQKLKGETKEDFQEQEFVDEKENEEKKSIVNIDKNKKGLYSFSLLLNLIFLILLGLCLAMIAKLKAQLRAKRAEEKANTKHINRKDLKLLDDLSNASDIQNFCINYFKDNYEFKSRNLNDLKEEVQEKIPAKKAPDFSKVFSHIDSAIYGQKKFMANYVRKELKKLIKKLPKKIKKEQKTKKNFKLNP